MPLKRMNLINTNNPDAFRKQLSDDDNLQDVLKPLENEYTLAIPEVEDFCCSCLQGRWEIVHWEGIRGR